MENYSTKIGPKGTLALPAKFARRWRGKMVTVLPLEESIVVREAKEFNWETIEKKLARAGKTISQSLIKEAVAFAKRELHESRS